MIGRTLWIFGFLERRGWMLVSGVEGRWYEWEKRYGFRKHALSINAITGSYYLEFSRMDGKEKRKPVVVSPDRHLPVHERPENVAPVNTCGIVRGE